MTSLSKNRNNTLGSMRRISSIIQVAVLAAASLLPLMLVNTASAAQMTDRQVTISTSESDATGVQYDFEFTTATSTAVQGIIFEFCDSPLGTCTLPTGMNVRSSLTTIDGDTGFDVGNDQFVEAAASNDCDDFADAATDTQYCVSDVGAGSTTAGALTVDLGGITNPTANETVYIRISLYSDAFSTLVHNGTVAAAIVDQLTINGRVQERLDFCVAAVDDGDALGTVAPDVSTCAGISDQNVDLGLITETAVAVAPVDADVDTGSDDDYGILMVNTNATLGTTLSYFAEDPTAVLSGDTHQLKAFRVVPADCDASAATLTDQCFQSADGAGTGTVITAGSELFGVYIPCIDTTQGSTANISADSNYDGNDNTTTSAADCENETFTTAVAVIGWNSGTTADVLGSSNTTIDNEIVKLRFAATAEATTPSGNYTVTTTYIATANF